jgi:hypothetical protein
MHNNVLMRCGWFRMFAGVQRTRTRRARCVIGIWHSLPFTCTSTKKKISLCIKRVYVLIMCVRTRFQRHRLSPEASRACVCACACMRACRCTRTHAPRRRPRARRASAWDGARRRRGGAATPPPTRREKKIIYIRLNERSGAAIPPPTRRENNRKYMRN